MNDDRVRVRLTVKGRVQGVGFRPTIYNFAQSLHLSGWVSNSPEGALIEVEGSRQIVETFIKELPNRLPPQARLHTVERRELVPVGYEGFEIRSSRKEGETQALIPPDLATCEDCLGELKDPRDRRHGYPFINCTNCGPRFTIIQGVPYDRPRTTMAPFKMCPECQREYDDPRNRRFHAQPDACPICGPKVWLEDHKEKLESEDPISEARRLLAQGKILALKSLGGFHLVCNAYDVKAVRELRRRKQRPDKPFAVMMRSLVDVTKLCSISEDEKLLLTSVSRPIVLMTKREMGTEMLETIAPRIPSLGVMLPYTPLHHLLFEGPERFHALVMTSGNRQDEPICRTNEEAKEVLAEIADFFLFHDREIHSRCDDSIARVFEGTIQILRRARGYVPNPVPLALSGPCVLATGPELKNTFCLTRRDEAYLSQYIGDLNDQGTLEFYQEALERMKRVLDVEPKVLAYDLHPDYLATRFAQGFPELLKIGVQHHHAHIASVMAEHHLEGPVIGVSFDGTGYGTDGQIWGGEFLLVEEGRFERLGHLAYLPMPGGEAAILEPWRMAVAYMQLSGFPVEECRNLLPGIGEESLKVVFRQAETRFNSPLTSSAGRLFDAAAALLGFQGQVTYEGQAACELEALAESADGGEPYPFVRVGEKPFELDLRSMFRGMVDDLRRGEGKGTVAGKFHATLTRAIVDACADLSRILDLKTVALSGGVFQNRILLESVRKKLLDMGLNTLSNQAVPVNDGGISLGQAWVALKWWEESNRG
jgi:hydrogenase maturation protein HypF